MNVASLATSAVAAHQAQTTQAMANAMIKQQTTMQQAIGRMLEQAIAQTSSISAGVDIIV